MEGGCDLRLREGGIYIGVGLGHSGGVFMARSYISENFRGEALAFE